VWTGEALLVLLAPSGFLSSFLPSRLFNTAWPVLYRLYQCLSSSFSSSHIQLIFLYIVIPTPDRSMGLAR
jgi:hypothetical protein